MRWNQGQAVKMHFNSEYFYTPATLFTWKILFFDQFFFTASCDPKNTSVENLFDNISNLDD
jgi:hypothetical protein